MRTGFKDKFEAAPAYKKKNEYMYDERSGSYWAQGNNFGVGYRQPVGSEEKKAGTPCPMGRVHTQSVDESK